MTRNELNKLYFNWMSRLVCDDNFPRSVSHRQLLQHLHNVEFVYILERDKNRAEDGIYLRYRFGDEHQIDDETIHLCFGNNPCSVLEMLVALVVRCEDIMSEPAIYGDRVSLWFWTMLDNLGISYMDNYNYNYNEVNDVLFIFLNRRYSFDGKGGLFTVHNPKQHMANVEIWYQMCWYLDSVS